MSTNTDQHHDTNDTNYTGLEIAVIGMAGRFPGARNIAEFRENLETGVESITFFTDEELEQAGVDPDEFHHPDYVKAMGVVEGVEVFDSTFFDYTPAEAELMDPQLRFFHECAWEALETSGYIPDKYEGLIGIYGGASNSFYWKALCHVSGKSGGMGSFEFDQLGDNEFLCSRVAYKLDLRGPVVFVHTACSTALVAVHMACQGLLSGETDIALAGGVSILPYKGGYLYREGMILSPDGHCRAFDDHAQGTIGANGGGIVVLKRLEDAINDGDAIQAIIKGSAMNNDGVQKIGFTAPSVEGQSEAIKEALRIAQVEPESIGYVETHGTGTPLGDPVEFEALVLGFHTDKKGYCGIGSVKTNIGHLGPAAGIAGLIKTILALKRKKIPPTLYFQVPNSKIDFIDSPFYINTTLKEWERTHYPRRAGVSSLGLGGTNVHVILEEYEENEDNRVPVHSGHDALPVLVSARTPSALEAMKKNLAEYLTTNRTKHPGLRLEDVAVTLHLGRKLFPHRWAVECVSIDDLIRKLTTEGSADSASLIEKLQSLEIAGRRIPLPTTPFEGRRYWIDWSGQSIGDVYSKFNEKPISKRKKDLSDWFYIPSWKQVPVPFSSTEKKRDARDGFCWLVFIDACGLGSQLVQSLKEGGDTVITVEKGSSFHDDEPLFREIFRERKIKHVHIVHLWNVTEPGERDFDESLETGFYHLLDMVRSLSELSEWDINDETWITVVSNGMQDVTGDEDIDPSKSVILGPVKVIPVEYANIRCRSIDVSLPQTNNRRMMNRLVRQLTDELTSTAGDPVIAFRGGHRWVQGFEPFRIEGNDDPVEHTHTLRLKQRGVYLITGGLGGIGMALAAFLAQHVKAKLILTNLDAFPSREEWDANLSGKQGSIIRKLLDMEKAGAEIMVCCGDTASDEDMKAIVAGAEERFGSIHGVIHCAGFPDGELIRVRKRELSERIFNPKLNGVRVLDRVFKNKHNALDFIVYCSSTSAIMPVIGQVAYCSANAFLDAYAHDKHKTRIDDSSCHHCHTVSINWDRWQRVGIAVIAEENHKTLTGEALTGGISLSQGVELFKRVLSYPMVPQVVVSESDFPEKLKEAYSMNVSKLLDEAHQLTVEHGTGTMLPRPELSVPYAAPVTSVQKGLCRVWEQALGFYPVGIGDNFFELGGDSLKVISLVLRIHKEIGVKISIEEFFKWPVIKDLAAYIEKRDISTEEKYVSIEPVEEKEYYPLSPAQKRMYLLQEMDTGSTVYNIPFVLPLGKDVDKKRLEVVLKQLIDRHESLRTSFHMLNDLNDEPVQRIHDDVEFEVNDLATEDTEFTEKNENDNEPKPKVFAELFSKSDPPEAMIQKFIRPFDLSLAPLMRSALIVDPGGNHHWVVDIHHIIADGISQAILIEDFIALYQGETLEPLRIQYKDFSDWQCHYFEKGKPNKQEEYWLRLYSDSAELPVLDLPTDFKRPEVFTFAGGNYDFMLDREDALKLKEWGSSHGATLFMSILTALNILFHHYTGQEDMIIGCGVAGRRHDDVQRTVGMFVNTLPMRHHPSGDQTCDSFLKEVMAQSLHAFENQDIQFEDLVDKLELHRDPSRNPLFDVGMVVQNFLGELNRNSFSIVDNEDDRKTVFAGFKNPASRFDLTFFVYEIGEDIDINIEYYTGIFKEETIKRLALHFQIVVKEMVKGFNRIDEIEIITEEEKNRILYEWNNTQSDYPDDQTIHGMFEEQALRSPDRMAVVESSTFITYRELNDRSNRLVYELRKKGAEQGTIIAIKIKRSIELITAILGILKSGGAYLPIDPSYPQERIDYMLTDSGAELLMDGAFFQEFRRGASMYAPGVPLGQTEMGQIRRSAPTRIFIRRGAPMCAPDAIFGPIRMGQTHGSAPTAYILYTSGSTGKPKGVIIQHHNVLRLVIHPNYIEWNPNHRLLLSGNIVFDITTFEIWGPLLNGLSLYLAHPDTFLDGEKLKVFLFRHAINILHLVPELFNRLATSPSGCSMFSGLDVFLIGGDRVNPQYVNVLRRECQRLKILHMYGPTENTTFSSFHPVEQEYHTAIPIGKPLNNTSIYMIDKHNELVPPGIIGELCVAGDGVALGYLNNPEMTVERFCLRRPTFLKKGGTKNFWFEESGVEGIYKTGDLARWLETGEIEFLGRMDKQIKIRGQRIEPGEIENHLLKHPEIKEAAIITRQKGNECYLCAVVIGHSPIHDQHEKEKKERDLRGFLSSFLPEYMIPSYFIFIDEMPLTPNGKIDRNALPSLETIHEKKYTAPRDKVETQLVQLWKDVLGSSHLIGIDDNFFQLGGHSLKAAILVSKIHKELNVKIPLVDMFKHQSIRELSTYIKQAKGSTFSGIEPAEEKEYYALSSAQKRMVILAQMDATGTTYNMPMILPLKKENGEHVDKTRLENAFKALIARHESLRTSFHTIHDVPVQIIHENVELSLTEVFLTERTEDAGLSLTEDTENTGVIDHDLSLTERTGLIVKQFIRPFDLSKAPLIRSGLIHLPNRSHDIWMIDVHHIISDGTSHNVLADDFITLFNGENLAPLTLQYKDFAEWQNTLIQKGELNAQENYWLNLYSDAPQLPVLELPADFKRPDVFTFEGDNIRFMLDREDGIRLKELALENGGTLFMTILSILNVLFYKYTGQEDIIIGAGISGRNHHDVQRIIGMFVNALATRNDPHGDQTYETFLKNVIAGTLDAFENQDIQFESLVEKLDLERNPSRNPLFDVLVIGQNFEKSRLNDPSLASDDHEHDKNSDFSGFQNAVSRFDLTVSVHEPGEDIYINIEYYTGIFKKETIHRLVSHFKTLIHNVCLNPHVRLRDIDIMTDEEKTQILFDFNFDLNHKNDTHLIPEQTVDELFEDQVKKTPDQIAVIGSSSLHVSYGELHEQSNILAQILKEKGTVPGEIVAIKMERSIEMIVALLGILKSGCAYLPIDPGYPQDRIDYMLNDSGAKLLATEFTEFTEGVKEKVKLLSVSSVTSVAKKSAYIIYTSGSTGKPKGVLVGHRGIIRLIKNQEYMDFSSRDRLLLTGQIVFDITTFEIWGSLLNNVALFLANKEVILNADELSAFMVKHHITILHLIPQLFNQLADRRIDIFAGLRYFLIGGDSVKPQYVNVLRNTYPKLTILHMYGPTENTTFSTFHRVERDYEAAIPIGKPLNNTSVYILDKDEQFVPVGITGELCVGGEGLAFGYLNNPELTFEKFSGRLTQTQPTQTKSFCPAFYKKRAAGGILYKTGDLGRWLPDGNIEFLGRIDHQVKIRGFRIELGEIENRLMADFRINEAVVIDRVDGNGDRALFAYIVQTEREKPVNYAEMREKLSQTLPDYMIPSYVMTIDKVPLNANGKIDKKALPLPSGMADKTYVAPRNRMEKRLIEIWSEVLGNALSVGHVVDHVIGMNDNFFELGGHSLKATVLIAKIYKEFGVKVPLAEFMKCQTVRALSNYLSDYMSKSEKETFIDIEPVSEKEYYPLSFNQKRLWIIQQISPSDNSYNMPGFIPLNETVDERIVRRTVETMIRNHESLRTGFREHDGQVVQYILDTNRPSFVLPFETIDLSSTDENEKQTDLKNILDRFAFQPFDLTAPPLFKSLLVKINEDRYVYAFNIHHIISDGWSMGILETDFHRIYNALRSNSEPVIENDHSCTYKDFAEWHNRQLEEPSVKETSRAFWIDFLNDELPALILPRDFKDESTDQGHIQKRRLGAGFRFVIPGDATDNLRIIAREHNVTLFSLLYAIYNIFLSVFSGQKTVVSSIVNAGRDHPSLHGIVGFFVNSVIFKTEINSDDVFIDFALRLQESVMEFFKHQHYPIELVLDEAGKQYPEVTASFNMINNYFNHPSVSKDIADSENKHTPEIQDVKFDIEPYLMEYRNGIEVSVSYNRSLFKAANIESMMEKYRAMVRFFASNPQKQIKEYKEETKRRSFKRHIESTNPQ
ncbi:MAG: amino acid adenylation domain-containing protein [Candidatus Omnitrophota bacterium]